MKILFWSALVLIVLIAIQTTTYLFFAHAALDDEIEKQDAFDSGGLCDTLSVIPFYFSDCGSKSFLDSPVDLTGREEKLKEWFNVRYIQIEQREGLLDKYFDLNKGGRCRYGVFIAHSVPWQDLALDDYSLNDVFQSWLIEEVSSQEYHYTCKRKYIWVLFFWSQVHKSEYSIDLR